MPTRSYCCVIHSPNIAVDRYLPPHVFACFVLFMDEGISRNHGCEVTSPCLCLSMYEMWRCMCVCVMFWAFVYSCNILWDSLWTCRILLRACVCVYMSVCVCTWVCVTWVCVYVSVCIRAHECVCVCTRVYMDIFIWYVHLYKMFFSGLFEPHAVIKFAQFVSRNSCMPHGN